MENGERWCQIDNKIDSNCSLTLELNHMYKSSWFDQIVKLPEQMGQGYWQRVQPNSFLELVICDVSFHDNMKMSSKEGGNSLNLGFCLGESIHWSVAGQPGEFGLESGGVSVYGDNEASNNCQYERDRRFQGLTIKFNHTESNGALQHLPLHKLSAVLAANCGLYYNTQSTPALKRVVHEITHCQYHGDIKRIYLEGKVMELVAIYLSESLMEKNLSSTSTSGLSRTDIASLQRAKDIVDANLISPPSLAALAQRVCLNEFKLKKGFKLLFGLPVYAYVIDQRLERAFGLLRESHMTITEAAYAVGFGKAGHFSEHFKKKFGVNPSDYFRHLKR
ncbi:AraC family transcriptional regulator [Paenibacillus sp. HWE-109]|uniref:helix-turn-helix domain-containing protein n=1 Tax=Paenibacillus sp. HWE-109 TaxID=1306526 RepID=UPI001EE0B600|nr:AraC family transcriptional regulator [Paenibacillus sp. HWE-109]UKS30457.1 AraC family transcriptional regulator [Paenibacillus sp. HWE-109]